MYYILECIRTNMKLRVNHMEILEEPYGIDRVPIRIHSESVVDPLESIWFIMNFMKTVETPV